MKETTEVGVTTGRKFVTNALAYNMESLKKVKQVSEASEQTTRKD